MEAFLLLRTWRDSGNSLTLELWGTGEEGPVRIFLTGQEAVMFVERQVPSESGRRREIGLRSLRGSSVDALYFPTQRALSQEKFRLTDAGHAPLESDIKPVERYLMERFITGAFAVKGTARKRSGVLTFDNPQLSRSDYVPQLRVLSFDIETVGFDGALLSIAGARETESRVFLVGPGEAFRTEDNSLVSRHKDERACLNAFCDWLLDADPDVLIGWNVIDFDLDYLIKLAKRLGTRLRLGRGGGAAEILAPRTSSQPTIARIPGRVVLDGIATLKSATFRFESFALDDVAQELLGRKKRVNKTADAAAEITRMAQEDPPALAEYNLEDCRLVLDIFNKARLIDFAVERQRLTGLPLDKQGGSVAAFDQLYLPRLHRQGYVAPSVGHSTSLQRSPGGYVMSSKPGFYKNVLVLDFKSLYPSIIRTFCVDPLGLALGLAQNQGLGLPGYDGAVFAREKHILPDLIETLWGARDEAKRQKNAAMSQAIKIMMNSFYGVLGTAGCRFFDHRLVSSITKRGHDIIQESAQFIETAGYDVIYGDTDSVFIHLSDDLDDAACDRIGKRLALQLTAHFQETLRSELQIDSHLELEFETHYRRFLMPTMRGSDVGTKKRYAGSIIDEKGEMQLVFKGMEVVRTDWTPLARSFQRELFRRIFAEEEYEEYIAQTTRSLRLGLLDEQLVYKKRLRRPVHEYEANVPPHVQAARQLPYAVRSIEYFITLQGPQPAVQRSAAIDYDHYVDRQLAPAADSILYFFGTDFSRIAGKQMSLF